MRLSFESLVTKNVKKIDLSIFFFINHQICIKKLFEDRHWLIFCLFNASSKTKIEKYDAIWFESDQSCLAWVSDSLGCYGNGRPWINYSLDQSRIRDVFFRCYGSGNPLRTSLLDQSRIRDVLFGCHGSETTSRDSGQNYVSNSISECQNSFILPSNHDTMNKK